MIEILEIAVYVATLYVSLGVVFGIAFVAKGVGTIDHNARGTGLGFRLAILPGAVALWPLLLARWRAGTTPPEESNAHRDLARKRTTP
mgnify:CR=1 FL=1